MKKSFWFFAILIHTCLIASAQTFTIHGKVIDQKTRQGIPYANVYIEGNIQTGTATDSIGRFQINNAKPGIHRLVVSCIGYKDKLTSEYMVSARTPFIEVELEEDAQMLGEVTISPSPLRRTSESPVSLFVIGLQDIEKIPGANRDISRIVRSFPGVSFSPIGYRNDLIVRGGGPSENRYFMDGIEIPNINHFSTQGASGGPVGIINSDLVREINFYTGAFPANRSGALSSVLDFSLFNGNPERQDFKATLGASEVSLSGSGHFSEKTTYLFSARQSYLQFMFKLLGLPFLPNYIDGQFKIKTRLNDKHELMFLGLGGIDRMKLNTDEKNEENEFLLSYLPVVHQDTYTLGASYKHYGGRNTQSLFLSHSYLNNRMTKYVNNDESSEENLMLRLRSSEQKTSLRFENRSSIGKWTWKQGAEMSYSRYTNHTIQRFYANQQASWIDYQTDLGIWSWGGFVSGDYTSPNQRLTSSFGIRVDASNLAKMKNPFHQLSPRISANYTFNEHWSVAGNVGIYYELPPYTALGFKDNEGNWVNRELKYQRVASGSMGVNWRPVRQVIVSVEGFYKRYSQMPLCIIDNIPLACKGNDYGIFGNEALVSSAQGRAYGVELLAKWHVPDKINASASLTLYQSEYRNNKNSPYLPSAWDNRYILNMSCVWDLPRQWSLGAKLSMIGGSPYTPYDIEKSALVEAWNAQGRPYYDYGLYNTERLSSFAQLDLRIDKNYYFKQWRLGWYVSIQNVTGSKLKQQDAFLSTGIIENPSAPITEQRYKLRTVKQETGSIIPSIGVTVEF
ncbi:MAG: TonB-dependent receptor [Bacteroidaceae bacterium]|nr:TonB-dependent receptor [Bacteroidaceae bacterium]